MIYLRTIKILATIATLLLIAVGVLAYCGVASAMYFLSEPKGRVSCADFGSYLEADAAYAAGATWLDKGGIRGIPCDALYIHYIKYGT